jgi:RimJ/RimL family protein N-acetyltransferase
MKDEKFIGGTKRLNINHISELDIEEARNLHNQESILTQLTDDSFVTIEKQLEWFETISKSTRSFRLICREKSNRALVGVFRIDHFDQRNKSAMIGLDISEEFREQGYALEIYNYMLNYFFCIKGFNRLYLNTLENNFKAKKLYEKLGFLIEGRQIKAIYREKRFLDLLCYYKLNQ